MPVFNCVGSPVNFTHKLIFQEHIQNYVKLSTHFKFFISEASVDILKPTVQTVNSGKEVGHNGHYQKAPVGTVNLPVSDHTVLTPQVGIIFTG